MRRLVIATLLGLCVQLNDAYGSTVSPLNTFPASGAANGPDAGFYALVLEMQEIALPFTTHAPGRVIEIATAITRIGGGEPCAGLTIGIVTGDSLLGSTAGAFNRNFVQSLDIVGTMEGEPCSGTDISLSDVSFPLSISVDWHLDPGDYWLVASFRSDIVPSEWLTNEDLFSDEWATRVCSGSCDTWQTLEQRGRNPAPMPGARITFEPGLRIAEPSSMAVLLGALMIVGVGVSWRSRSCHHVRRT